MLYSVAHIVRDKLPIVWDFIDWLNSWLFGLRYKIKLQRVELHVLNDYSDKSGLQIVAMRSVQAKELELFFADQPEDSYAFFRPHSFDEKSIEKLQRLKSFLAYILADGNVVVGYCFIRGFFTGKGFRGRMVGVNYRGRGYGVLMNRMLNDIGFGIGLKLFETVSKNNVASYRSALSASNVRVVKEMDNNDLFLEILK